MMNETHQSRIQTGWVTTEFVVTVFGLGDGQYNREPLRARYHPAENTQTHTQRLLNIKLIVADGFLDNLWRKRDKSSMGRASAKE